MSGAEILGVVASVIQIAELGGKLSVKLCTFCHRFKNANKSLRCLSKDIALTCNVLRQLGESLEQDDLATLCSPDAFETAQEVLKECEKVFQDLDHTIEQHYSDSSSKTRIERATKKIWFLMNEPHLDAMAGNLERLKSTMLLMLNVIIYAGQIRSRREANELQEQRILLLVLANEKLESERNYENLTKSLQYVSLNVSEPGTFDSFRANETDAKDDELYHYYNMVKTVLNDIDSVQGFLDSSRYQRIRSGFAGVHKMEASILQEKYGKRATQLFKGNLLGIETELAATIPSKGLTNEVFLLSSDSFSLDFSPIDPDGLGSLDFDTFIGTETAQESVPFLSEIVSNPMTTRKRKGRLTPEAQDDPDMSIPQEGGIPKARQKRRRAAEHTISQALPEYCISSPHDGASTEVQNTSSGETESAAPNDPPLEGPETFILRWTTLTETELGK
ncbi:hypothetical protein N7494_004087 [Penicillium frequentans]|uniref:Azaphilone pigments biosynthesis cluster protein L N-terminal domain-containing protein n=1 Tax=Penicillium frequentans TaxID=3151616 RepID=A0AAD6CZZ7_9EURO|nr:hypothetical protein N7494_004087 [Penicillium glabrum]